MLIYYRVFGIDRGHRADANVILIIAMLSLFKAALTLPGIAGIVLTVGTAVDANILIYERIREEIAVGALAVGRDQCRLRAGLLGDRRTPTSR